jgi:hypothetical protein
MVLRDWLLLLVTTLVGLGGLFYASSGSGGPSYGIGLVIFALAIVYAFYQVKQYFDRVDSERH